MTLLRKKVLVLRHQRPCPHRRSSFYLESSLTAEKRFWRNGQRVLERRMDDKE